MTATTLPNRNARPIRREDPKHLFEIGQLVRLKGGFGQALNASDIYRVTATLPPRGNSLQYRIRNDEERYERVATQDSLEQVVVKLPEANSALIERTFTNAQGTEAQQSRDQKAEAGQSSVQA